MLLTCFECAKLFDGSEQQGRSSAKGKNVYCGPVCIAKKSSRVASETNRKHASARMKKNNPMHDKGAREKVATTLKRVGHKPKTRGGNGTGLTEAERLLAEATGLKPATVPTHLGKGSGFPTCYKLDLADPDHKIGVEVDGNSHRARSRQIQDRKKENFLRSLGWVVLRISNEEVNKILS